MHIKFFIAVVLIAVAVSAFAQERAYVVDERGNVVVSDSGLCWRTGSWTPAIASLDPAVCGCDADAVPASVCTPPPIVLISVKPTSTKVSIDADTLFDFDKSTIRPAGKTKLDAVIKQAGSITLEVILVTGHTDRIGTVAYNQKLSDRRANTVKSYLVAGGVPADRIVVAGMGELQPVTTDCKNITVNRDLIACLQPDRRVEIQVLGTK